MSKPIGQVKVAAVQMDAQLGKPRENMKKILAMIGTAASKGAKLIVFPECALEGYMFDNPNDAQRVVQRVPGPNVERIADRAMQLDVHVIVGTLEKSGQKIYNTAFLVGPEGYIGKYRKIHLPHMGVDNYCTPGDKPPAVFDTPIGRIGIGICMDTVFPEVFRALAVQGADILALPTNTPVGTDAAAKSLHSTRAFENHCYVIYANRCGLEKGGGFMGLSMVFGVWGEILSQGSCGLADGSCSAAEEIVYATIEPEQSRNKRMEGPGWWIDLWDVRKPKLYAPICAVKK